MECEFDLMKFKTKISLPNFFNKAIHKSMPQIDQMYKAQFSVE